MSLFDYQQSRGISQEGYSWHAMLFELMRRADSWNAAKLRAAWPEEWAELQARHDAPGGVLDVDR